MKINIITQVEGVGQPVRGGLPGFGDRRYGVERIVYLNKAVINLIDHPDGVLVARKRWIQGGQVLIDIEVEDLLVFCRRRACTGSKADHQSPKNMWNITAHRFRNTIFAQSNK